MNQKLHNALYLSILFVGGLLVYARGITFGIVAVIFLLCIHSGVRIFNIGIMSIFVTALVVVLGWSFFTFLNSQDKASEFIESSPDMTAEREYIIKSMGQLDISGSVCDGYHVYLQKNWTEFYNRYDYRCRNKEKYFNCDKAYFDFCDQISAGKQIKIPVWFDFDKIRNNPNTPLHQLFPSFPVEDEAPPVKMLN